MCAGLLIAGGMNHLPLKHFDGDTISLTDSHLLQHSVIGNNHLSGHQSDQNPVTNPNLHTTRHFLQHNVLAPRRHQSDPGQYLNRGPSIMSDQMLRVPQTNVEFVPQHRRAKSAATFNMFALSMSQNALSISERRSPEGRPSPNYKDIQLDENGNQVFASPTAVVGQVMRRPNTLGLHGAESMNRNGTNSRVPAFRRSLSDPIGFSMLSIGTHDDDIGHANLTTPDAGSAPNYPLTSVDEESDSDDDLYDTHPNKFPVAIEEHGRRECGYYRQKFRSGHQVFFLSVGFWCWSSRVWMLEFLTFGLELPSFKFTNG